MNGAEVEAAPERFSFQRIEDAATRLLGFAITTPLLCHEALDARAGGKLWVKAECLQRTGSFKFRGAYNRLSRLTEAQKRCGVVAFSSGNHAQGVAAAAKLVGCPAVIVMPSDAPRLKVEQTRAYGAEVVLYDRVHEDREAIGAALAKDRGAVLVPPFDDLDVMAGQGTAGLELITQAKALGAHLDVVSANASGGGLMAGVATAVRALSPKTRIVIAEPGGFDDFDLSLKAGKRVAHAGTATTLCDALMVPMPGALTFPVLQGLGASAVCASDDEVLEAMALAFRYLKIVVEPGGAVALAAALAGRLQLNGGTGAVIATGGNVDPEVFRRALERI